MAIKNQFKTVVLLGILTGILLGIGSFWGRQGLIIGLIFAVVINFGSYWFSDKIVLAIYRAKKVTEKEAPELHSIVKEVADLAKMPMPKVYIVPSETPNAFAVGRSYKKAAVAFNQGIIELLSKDELKGVAAHEISHIKNRDTLIQTVAATIAGVISYIAIIARFGAFFGGRDDDNGSGLEFLVLAILTPILATLIQLAISRSREYLADENAAKLLHSGSSLASALEKLEAGVKSKPMAATGATETTAHMMIINPFSKGGLVSLFMTHPPVKERVKRLRNKDI